MLFNVSDQQLIDKALDGSQRAWVKLVSRYEGKIYNYCLRMTGAESEAMDLMQEVFLAVYRNLPNFRDHSKLTTWLFRIAANKSTDWLRAKHRIPSLNAEEIDDDSRLSNQTPHNDYHQMQSNQQITQSLAKLTDEQRLVVELKFFQQFTFEEIAMQTGTSTNTVKTRLYAALKHMKGHMEVQHVV